MKINLLFVTILMAAIDSSILLIFANPQALVMNSNQSQTTSDLGKPIRLETFADRLTVKQGEHLNIKVWMETKVLESSTIAIFFAEDQLTLQGSFSRSASLPMDSPITFTFLAKGAGKPNILVRIEGANKSTKEMTTVSQQIQSIEIQAKDQWWSPLLSSSLLGVIIGALLTFGTTWLNEYRQRRVEKRRRKQWIINDLPAQLAFDRAAVLEKRETKFELWRNKLATEGYYADLDKLTKQKSDSIELAPALIKAGFDLQSYEELRSKDRLEGEFHETIAKVLGEIMEGLKGIKNK